MSKYMSSQFDWQVTWFAAVCNIFPYTMDPTPLVTGKKNYTRWACVVHVFMHCVKGVWLQLTMEKNASRTHPIDDIFQVKMGFITKFKGIDHTFHQYDYCSKFLIFFCFYYNNQCMCDLK